MKNKIFTLILTLLASITSYGIELNEIQKWKTIDFRKISFDVPLPYSSTVDLGNTNQYTWLVYNDRISITIDIGNIPNGKENLKINELIPNIKSFAQEVNNGNKRDFPDFKVLSEEYIYLGDTYAVLVNQQSKQVSGKNKLYNVHSYFVTASPHFYSVVISYDTSSYNDRKVAEKIASSFVFSNTNSESEPTLAESNKWLVNKLSNRLVKYQGSTDINYGPITFWTHYYENVGIENGNLIFKYKEEIKSPKGGYEIGHNTTTENIKVIIPLNKIIKNDFDNSRTFNGKCDFEIYAQSNSITEINLTTGKKKFKTFHEFSFDCSEEENLGERLNKAIIHIKNLAPLKKKKKKETF